MSSWNETFEGDLRSALKTKLLAVPGLPAMAFEARGYKPVVGTPYIKEKLVTIAEQPGSNGTISHRLTYNLSLRFPNGSGTGVPSAMRGRILDVFKPGLKLAYGTATCVVMASGREPNMEDTDWLYLPLTIVVQAWTLTN